MSIRWKSNMVGDERLLRDYLEYLKKALITGELAIEQT
jgi:hypothetical protein